MEHGRVCFALAVLITVAGDCAAQGTFPCNFETDFCAWTQDSTEDFDWMRNINATNTTRTGPPADHTSGSGYYAYIEASTPRNPNDSARLVSPLFDGSAKCLTFWYYMYGDSMGNLSVYNRSEPSQPPGTPVFRRSGSQGRHWLQANVNLSSTAPLQVVIEATVGSSFNGDIAIDDISFTDGQCPSGEPEIRLVNGQRTWEGRVEVYLNGQWGTVCDFSWDNDDAEVACRQLGLNTTSAKAFSDAHFGQGSSNILLDYVQCMGSESRLADCDANPVGNSSCGHYEDAGVSCGSGEPEIRLVNGQHAWEGRVEVYMNGQWGTICDDNWNNDNAEVACRQLGLNTTSAQAISGAHFGQGSSILLDEVQCIGSESLLADCNAYPVGGNCQQNGGAGVSCGFAAVGDIRLVNRQQPTVNSWYGRVEIYLNGEWGTVCDNDWDDNDARVVCLQLGLKTTSAVAFSQAHFDQGSGSILLDGMECLGNESRLTDCAASPVGQNNCEHSDDAGVSCDSSAEPEIRLVNGDHTWEGRVEVYLNGQWGTVCDDSWDNNDAEVVCRELGLNTGSAVAFTKAHFGPGSGSILLDDVLCRGTEARLAHCTANEVRDTNCGHNEDAGVSCDPAAAARDIRLVNSQGSTVNSLEGRVEIYLNGEWGTVCDDDWDKNDARVVCRHLGLNTISAVAFSLAHFGQGSGKIHLDNVNCTGFEARLTDCAAGTVNCGHNEDAGVSCRSSLIRLVNGQYNGEGRVEVYLNGQWGTVCDDSWDNDDAKVVCRQLGLNTSSAMAFSDAHFGQGSGNIFLANVQCTGSEAHLTDCTANPVGGSNCGHSKDAGVSCTSAILLSGSNNTGLIVGLSVGACVLLVLVVVIAACCLRRKANQRRPAGLPLPVPLHPYAPDPAPSYAPAVGASVYSTPSSDGVTSPAYAYRAPPPAYDNPSHPDNSDKGQAGATLPAYHAVSDADPTVAVPPDSSACLPAYSPHMAFTHPPSDSSQL